MNDIEKIIKVIISLSLNIYDSSNEFNKHEKIIDKEDDVNKLLLEDISSILSSGIARSVLTFLKIDSDECVHALFKIAKSMSLSQLEMIADDTYSAIELLDEIISEILIRYTQEQQIQIMKILLNSSSGVLLISIEHLKKYIRDNMQ